MELLMYNPFNSIVTDGVWHKINQVKLDDDRLQETRRPMTGSYEYISDVPPLFTVDGTCFNIAPDVGRYSAISHGVLLNKNTIEEFRDCSKAELIDAEGKLLWQDVVNGTCLENPSLLTRFVLLTFADMKKYNYYYWFAFPVPNNPTVMLDCEPNPISEFFDEFGLQAISDTYKDLDVRQKSFFRIQKKGEVACIPILPLPTPDEDVKEDFMFAFVDPSPNEHPGWPLRNFIAMLAFKCPALLGNVISIVGLRMQQNGDCRNSMVFDIRFPEAWDGAWGEQWFGWERNEQLKLTPRLAKMADSMDPLKLAESSVDLNLKLMKWRLMPDLDLNVIKDTKCLLLGAGTLGCAVARSLLSWGVRKITLVDNGKVSYSNPVRQTLYFHEDCIGRKEKAPTAAENLKKIYPGVESRGVVLHIPMPGHPVGESLRGHVARDIHVLTEEISSHDIIFLLLDSREARWLPTLLGAHYGKIVINAALGFDSYLVMRHGFYERRSGVDEMMEDVSMNDVKAHTIPGGKLGCYFCNDVTAPGNSQKDRTLDQQCTVTRPGVSCMAGALAAEIAISLTQHKKSIKAPAPYNLNGADFSRYTDEDSLFGMIPHSIRGFLSSYQQVLPTSSKFKQCIACSDPIMKQFEKDGTDFLMRAFNSGKYLEDVTGLTELHVTANSAEMWAMSDSDEE